MRIGIVGHEAAKFTPETEAAARARIRSLLTPDDVVVSGACHLGGIDRWAIEEAQALGLPCREWPPHTHTWTSGYRPRNMQIVHDSDRVVCLVVRKLPDGYRGMRFEYCYHCHTNDHVKSGGCWTVKYARLTGKPGEILIID